MTVAMTTMAMAMTEVDAKLAAVEDDNVPPERKCAVCRKASEREVLLHFVRSPEGRLAFDVRRKLQGRGISVCPKPACLQKLRPGLPGIQAMGPVQPLDKRFWTELST